MADKNVQRSLIETASKIINSHVFKSSGRLVFTPGQQLCVEPATFGQLRAIHFHNTIEHCHGLSVSESVLLFAIRLWVKGALKNIETSSSVPGLSAHLGLSDTGCLINALMHETALWSSRRFDVRCLCTNKISDDEARILCFCAALSNNDLDTCRNCLDNWLPNESANALMKNGANSKCTSQLRGLGLPSRAWIFDLLNHARSQHSSHLDKAVSRTLH